jgi:hypothetical protein
MKKLDISTNFQTVGGFIILVSLAFVISKFGFATAQSSSSTLSGTYVCLSNSNMSGYVANKTADTNGTAGINQMFTLTFDANNPSQVTLVGLVENKISHYEDASNVATISNASQPNVTLAVTANSPSPYIYKLVASSGGVRDYYIGVTNTGNSLFFMSAPTSTSTMNGACQKV